MEISPTRSHRVDYFGRRWKVTATDGKIWKRLIAMQYQQRRRELYVKEVLGEEDTEYA